MDPDDDEYEAEESVFGWPRWLPSPMSIFIVVAVYVVIVVGAIWYFDTSKAKWEKEQKARKKGIKKGGRASKYRYAWQNDDYMNKVLEAERSAVAKDRQRALDGKPSYIGSTPPPGAEKVRRRKATAADQIRDGRLGGASLGRGGVRSGARRQPQR